MYKFTTYCILFCLFTATQFVYPAGLDDFVITVQTDIEGPSTQFTIPTTGEGYNYNVDCNNDGNHEFTAQTGNVTCEYNGLGGAGIYTIRIEDNSSLGTGFPRIYFNNRYGSNKLIGINQWGTGQWSSMSRAFFGCYRLTDVGGAATDTPDLSNVTDMSFMFRRASSFNQDLGGWNTSNVTNMSAMFTDARKFNQDIGSWNTANVIDMNSMFWNARAFNGDIGNWNTGMVTGMAGMFSWAVSFNQDIGGWNTSNVTTMAAMFDNAWEFNQDIDSWDTANVTTMAAMFWLAHAFNGDVGNWNTTNVTNMHGMFLGAGSFNQDIGNWNTANVTQMIRMFESAISFNQDLQNWNTRNVTNMSQMFFIARSFNQAIGKWNTGNVTNMSSMFFYARSFNQDIGNWNTANVTNMSDMFIDAGRFNQDIGNWNTANVTNMDSMFRGAGRFNQDISNWNTSNVVGMQSMFEQAIKFNQDISNWNTSNVVGMESMFLGAAVFDQDIGGWNISKVLNMRSMFRETSLSTDNYDSLLIGWSNQLVQPRVEFSGGGSKYCYGVNARSKLISEFDWQITDRGFGGDCHTVGVRVSHLAGSNLVLQINGSDDLQVNSSGFYTFDTVLFDDSEYIVSMLKQPTNPDQHCILTNAHGVISETQVSNVLVNCKAACDDSYVHLNDNETAIDVVATGSDDTTNIQCALDMASQKGIPLVRLGKADYQITSILAEEFNGSFQGTTRNDTKLFVENHGLDCEAMAIRGFTPSAIKFVRGEPRLRYMTIIADRPCAAEPVLENLIHFTGRNARDTSCKSDVIFGSVERIDLVGPGRNKGILNAIDVSPEARALGGCKDTLLGTFKLNRSSVNNFTIGINTTMKAGAQVDFNFNEFNQNSAAISLANTNQSSRIVSNLFVGENTSSPNGVPIGVKLTTTSLSAPNKTRVVINNNEFRFTSSVFERYYAIHASAYNGGVPNASMSVTNNKFIFSGGLISNGFGGYGVWIINIPNGEISANQFIGSCDFGVYIDSSLIPKVSNWTISANTFEHLNCEYKDISLGFGTREIIVGPGQGATIDDSGTGNIILPQ